MRRTTRFVAGLAVCLLAVPALAQAGGAGEPGPRRAGQAPALEPEKSQAAWELQAQGVARRLTLSEEATKQLTTAYVDARKAHQKAVDAMRAEMRERRRGEGEFAGSGAGTGAGRGAAGAGTGTGAGRGAAGAGTGTGAGRGAAGAGTGTGAGAGQGAAGAGAGADEGQGDADRPRRRRGSDAARRGWNPEMRQALRAVEETERSKLKTAMTAVLAEEQLESAYASLGTFNRRWDVMVDTVAGFELEEENTFAALNAIETYMTTFGKIMRSGDRQAMRGMMREARDELASSLEALLTEEQMEEMQSKMGRRGRGGDRPRPGEIF